MKKYYCKTEAEFLAEAEAIKAELPKTIVQWMEEEMKEEGNLTHVLYFARLVATYGALPTCRNAKDDQTLAEVLDKKGYIRHDLWMSLQLLRLYSDVFELSRRGGFDKSAVFSCYKSSYETFKPCTWSQVTSVRKFIEKTLSPEEAFAVKEYYGLGSGLSCLSLATIAKQLNVKYTAAVKLRNDGLKKLASTGVYHTVKWSDPNDFRKLLEKEVFIPRMPKIFETISEENKRDIEDRMQSFHDFRESRDDRAWDIRDSLIEELSTLCVEERGSKTQEWVFSLLSYLCYPSWEYSVWHEGGIPKMRFRKSKIVWTGKI